MPDEKPKPTSGKAGKPGQPVVVDEGAFLNNQLATGAPSTEQPGSLFMNPDTPDRNDTPTSPEHVSGDATPEDTATSEDVIHVAPGTNRLKLLGRNLLGSGVPPVVKLGGTPLPEPTPPPQQSSPPPPPE